MDSTVIPTLTEDQRNQLLERQFQTAMAGSEALQIHLGKAYLGQHDKHQVTVEAVPMADQSYEQLLDLLEQRQADIPDEKLVAELGASMAAVRALPAPIVEITQPTKKRRKK